MLHMLLSGGNGYARIHLRNLKIDGREGTKREKHVFCWFCICLFCICECIYFRGRRAKQSVPGTS